jgi:hypothetical protein
MQPVPARPRVVGRHTFYNHSAFDGFDPTASRRDDGAIATDKAALLGGQTATFAHVTSYIRGINGVMIDVTRLPAGRMLTVSDFEFRGGPAPGAAGMTATSAATSVSVRRGEGVSGSDRVTLAWSHSAVKNGWLQVTLKANDSTALATADVFYFGNLVGETGDAAASLGVTAADWLRTRAAQSRTLVGVTSAFDFNHDRRVNIIDVMVVRSHQQRGLAMLPMAMAPATALPLRASPLRRWSLEESGDRLLV